MKQALVLKAYKAKDLSLMLTSLQQLLNMPNLDIRDKWTVEDEINFLKTYRKES